jgi:3-oxosteroid 1-dehydrogenase
MQRRDALNGSPRLASEYDVVVLGAGAGGMTAALVAATEGLRVLLVERTAQVGGSTSRSAGTLWIPGNFSMNKTEALADVEAARLYLDTVVGDRSRTGLREQFLRSGPEMLRYLQKHSVVHFQECPKHTDYYPDLPGAKPGGRPVEAQVFDGRKLGKEFGALRSTLPEFMVFRGMMVSKADVDKLLNVRQSLANQRHAASLVFRYAADRLLGYARGTRLTMGNALCGRLLRSVIDAGATLRLRCEVTRIVRESGASHALNLDAAEGSHAVRSKRAVVFAGGGFSANARWRAAHMPSPTPEHTAASESNDATTMELALRLGAVLGAPCEHNAWWFPSSIVRRNDGSVGVFPHIIMDRAKPGLIAVDENGRRFVNEGINYHEFSVAQYRHNAVPCWLVCDTRFIRRYGLGAVHPGGRSRGHDEWVRQGYLKRGETLDDLARQIGVTITGLRSTVERMAQFAATGTDLDFGKGTDRVSRQNGDAANVPNPCLGAIKTPPFYAVQVAPADLGTSLGLVANEHAQLLDAAGGPLPGLYACGNDMNSIMGGTYPAPGVTLGPAMTFGYLAAQHIASKSDDDPYGSVGITYSANGPL